MHFYRLYTRLAPPAADGKRSYVVSTSPGPRRSLALDEPPCLVELLRPGDKLAAAGDVSGALGAYREVQASVPGLPALAERIAKCHARLGDFSKAESFMERAIMLAGPLPDLYQGLGEIYEAGGQAENAVDAFEKAAALDSGNAARWVLLARACRRQGDKEKTAAAIGYALAADPGNKEALALKGDTQ